MTLQLQLQLRYTTLHPAVVVRWPLQPLPLLQKHNSNHLLLLVHQWIRSAICDSQQPTSPIGLLFLKLPLPPCAVLQVHRIYSNDGRRGWCPTRPSQQNVYICIHSSAVLGPLQLVAVAVQNAQDGMMPRRCDIWAPAPLSCCPGLPGMLGQFRFILFAWVLLFNHLFSWQKTDQWKLSTWLSKENIGKQPLNWHLKDVFCQADLRSVSAEGSNGHPDTWSGDTWRASKAWDKEHEGTCSETCSETFRDVLDVSLSCKDPRGRYTACSAWWLLSETPARLVKRESSVGMEIQKLRQQKENAMRSASKPWRCGMWKPQYGIWATLHNPPAQTHGVYLFPTGQHNKWTCTSTAGWTTFVATRLVPVLIIANHCSLQVRFPNPNQQNQQNPTSADSLFIPFPSMPHITWRVEDRRIWRGFWGICGFKGRFVQDLSSRFVLGLWWWLPSALLRLEQSPGRFHIIPTFRHIVWPFPCNCDVSLWGSSTNSYI